jgi:hypothetical protein
MITEKEYQENKIFYHEFLFALLKERGIADESDNLKYINFYKNFKGYRIFISNYLLEINNEFWLCFLDKSDYKAFIKLLKLLKVEI